MLTEITSKQWRKTQEDGLMRKYLISRTRVRKEYKDVIQQYMDNPPSWIKLSD